MILFQFIFLVFFCSVIQARISPKPDESSYNVVGFTPGKFHTCEIIDIFVLPDEATILSIVSINNAGPWSLPSSYLEIMYRNGSTIQFGTSVIGDTNGQCTFGAKFIPYYNNSQGNGSNMIAMNIFICFISSFRQYCCLNVLIIYISWR
jgi:hypothetical protein